jgi:hypothetical protein
MALVAGVGIAGSPGMAAASPLYVVPGNSLQVPAGGTVYLQVRGIALQPGASIPSDPLSLAAQAQQPPAGDRIRTTLFYGIDWGYSESAPQQVALAVWWAQDGNWRGTDHAIAERIASAAANAPGIPSWNPDGRNLLTVISQGQASISALTLSPLQQTLSVGSGTLTIRNTSGSDMTVYLPYGTIFTGASGSALVWATGVGAGPSQATPTGQAVVQPTATSMIEATPVPPTSTPLPIAPTMVSSKGGGDPPPAQQPTDTPLPTVQFKGASATPTDAPPTDTPLPPTDTPQPTSTPRPSDTPLPVSTSTPVPQQPSSGGTSSQPSAPQLPPSQPQKPVQQKGNGNTQSSAPSAPQSDVSRSSQAPSGAPSQQPGGASSQSADAPLPLTAEPTHSPTPSSAGANAGAAAPPPVGTTFAGPPSPVGTAAAKATVPFPVVTVFPTAVTGNAPPTKQAETPPAVQTAATSGGAGASDGTANAGSAGANPPEKPTPAPTPIPAPVEKPAEPPVIVVTPPGTNDGSAASGSGSNVGPSPAGGQQGAPKENPVTGAGPSSMPLWLSGAALMMLLGGWALRRVGRAAPVRQAEE